MVGLEDDLGVALGEEAIAHCLQLGTQLAKIVNAAIECDAEAQRRVDHRLLRSRREIEDAETAMAERNSTLHVHASRIGAARLHCVIDAAERCERRLTGISDFTTNAAHRGS